MRILASRPLKASLGLGSGISNNALSFIDKAHLPSIEVYDAKQFHCCQISPLSIYHFYVNTLYCFHFKLLVRSYLKPLSTSLWTCIYQRFRKLLQDLFPLNGPDILSSLLVLRPARRQSVANQHAFYCRSCGHSRFLRYTEFRPHDSE